MKQEKHALLAMAIPKPNLESVLTIDNLQYLPTTRLISGQQPQLTLDHILIHNSLDRCSVLSGWDKVVAVKRRMAGRDPSSNILKVFK